MIMLSFGFIEHTRTSFDHFTFNYNDANDDINSNQIPTSRQHFNIHHDNFSTSFMIEPFQHLKFNVHKSDSGRAVINAELSSNNELTTPEIDQVNNQIR